jgi:flagellin
MGLRINSNIAALTSYNNLQKTDKAVSSSLEKLSSGFRINKAADDAAGLVVSEGLKSQIGGLTVAARNAQDGVNVAQTVDGALSTQTDILQRMRDLAVQAANSGSQDSTAQQAANTEFNSLKSELSRIAKTTAFGGQNLLDGSYAGGFQVGANNGQSIGINLNSGIFGTAQNTETTGVASTVTLDASAIAGGKALIVKGQTVTTAASGETADSLGAKIQSKLGTDDYTVAVSGTNITITANSKVATTYDLTVNNTAGALTATTPVGAITTGVTQQLPSATGFDATGLKLGSQSLWTSGATGSANAAAASTAIDYIDNALKGVSTARASIGAIQNRFEKAIDNLNTAIQNITASNSAIRDTDMAAEMTKFTKNQVLSQAGTSMLAQANSSTQNILTLLRG